MLKKFTINEKTFTPKQNLVDVEQWECGGDLFTVPKGKTTRKGIYEVYEILCDEDDRFGTEFKK